MKLTKRPIAYAHIAHGLDVTAYRERYRRGEVPDETPYGFHHAEDLGWTVVFPVDRPDSSITKLLRRALMRLLGFDILHAFYNRKAIQAADIVWTMEEVSYLAVCALPLIVPGMKRPRLIAQTVWLFNTWASYSSLRRWMLKKLLQRTDRLTFHSQQYLPLVSRTMDGVQPVLSYFGISLDSFPWRTDQRKANRPIRIFSLGNDRTRDWTTLLKAFGSDERFEVVVVCSWLEDEALARHNNVTCPRKPTMPEFRDFYLWADFVIVPMVPNLYSGITVALEAASLGTPVISSETGGVPTYFDTGEVLFVPPQDATALLNAVLVCNDEERSMLVRRAQKRFLRDDYSTRGMAKRYVALSTEILQD